jgi:hypothetical protein
MPATENAGDGGEELAEAGSAGAGCGAFENCQPIDVLAPLIAMVPLIRAVRSAIDVEYSLKRHS